MSSSQSGNAAPTRPALAGMIADMHDMHSALVEAEDNLSRILGPQTLSDDPEPPSSVEGELGETQRLLASLLRRTNTILARFPQI